jgi:hypothetical protein
VPPAVALLNYKSSGKRWRIFCQVGIFRGVFSENFLTEGSVKLRWAGGRGLGDISNMISCPALSRIFSKTGIYMGFSLYNIFTGRNSEAAMTEGGEGIKFLGCSKAQLGCCVAQIGRTVAQ